MYCCKMIYLLRWTWKRKEKIGKIDIITYYAGPVKRRKLSKIVIIHIDICNRKLQYHHWQKNQTNSAIWLLNAENDITNSSLQKISNIIRKVAARCWKLQEKLQKHHAHFDVIEMTQSHKWTNTVQNISKHYKNSDEIIYTDNTRCHLPGIVPSAASS